MRIIDVSVPISPNLPTWPGDPRCSLERISKIEDGANANVSFLSMTVHTGTHLDAPDHFINGAQKIGDIPLDLFIGEVFLVQIPDSVDMIDEQVIVNAGIADGVERVFFKTRNSGFWEKSVNEFQKDFVAITPSGATCLVQKGIKMVGIDYLSVAPYADGITTHQIFLNAGMILVEGLDLSKVDSGTYSMICMPLKLDNAEGAPARVVLVREE